MSEEMMQTSPFECPAWFDGKKINETVFCEEFLRDYPMVTVNDAFFTVNGRVHDENRLKKVIYDRIKYYVTSGVAKKVTNLLDVMRMECCTAKLSLYQDRIHVANGTYYLNGTFSPEKDFCRNRLPVAYNPDAPQPVTWLHFLSQLLEPEDILTLQEFMGYCFIPSTKGQKMLLLIGKGGEGKSRIGIVLRALLGSNMNTGSMHLCFVPLTEDKRLCAKEILGNKKKLTQWQDKYWEHMVKKYPDLERGESASETGRDHIPTRVFKQMARLNKQHDKLAELLSDMKFTNYKERSAQIAAFLEKYIPDVAAMETQMKKYKKFFKTADGKQKALEKKNDELTAALEKSEKESTVKKLQEMRLHSDYERIKGILDRIPPEIIRAYTHRDSKTQEVRHYR